MLCLFILQVIFRNASGNVGYFFKLTQGKPYRTTVTWKLTRKYDHQKWVKVGPHRGECMCISLGLFQETVICMKYCCFNEENSSGYLYIAAASKVNCTVLQITFSKVADDVYYIEVVILIQNTLR